MGRIELPTSPLPRECSTTEPHGPTLKLQPYRVRGAGEGNRTLVLSLEGFSSTIELHPQNPPATKKSRKHYNLRHYWWREKDSNLRRQSRQIYSLIPLTAWVSLQPVTEKLDSLPMVCQSFFRAGRQYSRHRSAMHFFLFIFKSTSSDY